MAWIWNKEKDEILLFMLSEKPITEIAKKLKCTPMQVEYRLRKLGHGEFSLVSGTMRTKELAKILGVDFTTILRFIREEGLPAVRFFERGPTDTKYRFNYIYQHMFWDWADQNRHLLNFKLIKRGMLVPEPDWLDEAVKNETKAKRHQAYWTPEEDRIIWRAFYQEGLTQEAAGLLIGRSQKGVTKRLSYLRKQKFNEKRETHVTAIS